MFKNKKGQMVIISLSIILFLFLLILFFFFEYLVVSPVLGDNRAKLLEAEATRLSDSLLLPGFPTDWNSTHVQKVGLTSNDVLNISKIKNLSAMDYGASKARLGVQFDYFINISYKNETAERSFLINNTGFDNIFGESSEKMFIVTRERATLIREGDRTFPAKIFIASYN